MTAKIPTLNGVSESLWVLHELMNLNYKVPQDLFHKARCVNLYGDRGIVVLQHASVLFKIKTRRKAVLKKLKTKSRRYHI